MATPNERREVFLHLMREEFLSKATDIPLVRGRINDVFTELHDNDSDDDLQAIADLAYELGLEISFALSVAT